MTRDLFSTNLRSNSNNSVFTVYIYETCKIKSKCFKPFLRIMYVLIYLSNI